MSRRYFGTDGVRGRVGSDPMTVSFAIRLAHAAAKVLAPTGGTVLIGKDTRVSGYMLESALEAGFVAAGVNVRLVGPLPTPAIAYLTQRFKCDFGVVISASHNGYADNGIKFFDGQGSKLSDEREAQIEKRLEEPAETVHSDHLGRAKRIDEAGLLYQQFCHSAVGESLSLEGLKLVVDCAHGASYKVAPQLLAQLGADVIPIGCSPNGRNINAGCGSTHPELLSVTVQGVRAHAGIAFDGDGDRLVMVNHRGEIVDGDQLLYILALGRKARGTLQGPVVGTVMSNLGLEKSLKEKDIPFERVAVGDRYVLERLKQSGGVLGGETSGHLLLLDRATTGDALVNALEVLKEMVDQRKTLAQLTETMPKFPQVLKNVRTKQPIALDAPALQQAVKVAEGQLQDRGRIVLRASGTEPVIRVMVEGEDMTEVSAIAQTLADVVAELAA